MVSWVNSHALPKASYSLHLYWGTLFDVTVSGMPCLTKVAFSLCMTVEAGVLCSLSSLKSAVVVYCDYVIPMFHVNRPVTSFCHGLSGILWFIMGSLMWYVFMTGGALSSHFLNLLVNTRPEQDVPGSLLTLFYAHISCALCAVMLRWWFPHLWKCCSCVTAHLCSFSIQLCSEDTFSSPLAIRLWLSFSVLLAVFPFQSLFWSS